MLAKFDIVCYIIKYNCEKKGGANCKYLYDFIRFENLRKKGEKDAKTSERGIGGGNSGNSGGNNSVCIYNAATIIGGIGVDIAAGINGGVNTPYKYLNEDSKSGFLSLR